MKNASFVTFCYSSRSGSLKIQSIALFWRTIWSKINENLSAARIIDRFGDKRHQNKRNWIGYECYKGLRLFWTAGHQTFIHCTRLKRSSRSVRLPYLLQGVPITTGFFSKAHCPYKNYPILRISSLLGRQWVYFYVGIIYNNINSFLITANAV